MRWIPMLTLLAACGEEATDDGLADEVAALRADLDALRADLQATAADNALLAADLQAASAALESTQASLQALDGDLTPRVASLEDDIMSLNDAVTAVSDASVLNATGIADNSRDIGENEADITALQAFDSSALIARVDGVEAASVANGEGVATNAQALADLGATDVTVFNDRLVAVEEVTEPWTVVGDTAEFNIAGELRFTVAENIFLIDETGILQSAEMVEVIGDATVEVQSPMTTMSGDGVLTLNGGLVAIN